MVRRSRDALLSLGEFISGDDVIVAIAADLAGNDAVINGVGVAGADKRIADVVNTVSAQVLIEALSNNLRVNGVLATTAMDNAVLISMPSAPESETTGNVRITQQMLDQSSSALQVARQLAPSATLDSILNTINGIAANSLPSAIQGVLPPVLGLELNDAINVATTGSGSQPLPGSTTDTDAPIVPQNLSAAAVSQTQVNLSWSASTDFGGGVVSGYRIYRSGVQVGVTVGTTYSDTGLTADTSYSYQVSAFDDSANVSVKSIAISVATPASEPDPGADTQAPTVPAGFNAVAVNPTQVDLSWSGSADLGGGQVAGYNIYRNGTKIGSTWRTSYSDLGVSEGTTYSYAVASYDSASPSNESAQSSAVSVTTPYISDTQAPTVPQHLSAPAVTSERIDLSWSASTDVGGGWIVGYNVYRNGVKVASVPNIGYSDTNVMAGISYNYSVIAFDNAVSPNYSMQSTVLNVTTPDANTTPGSDALAYNCTRYIDSVNGTDSNSATGSSPGDAWKTLDWVAELSRNNGFGPGEVICFRRDRRHIVTNGWLGAGGRGTEAEPIVYGAYGDEALPLPRLSPSIRIDNTNDWQAVGSGIFIWPNSHASWTPSGVWEDGNWLKPASSEMLVDGGWYYKNGVGLYVRISSGQPSEHEIYFAKKYGVFGIAQSSYLTIRDLAFEYSGAGLGGGVLGIGKTLPAMEIHDVNIQNCTFQYMTTAIEFRTSTISGIPYENHDINITGNTISDVRYALWLHSDSNGPERQYNFVIKDNYITNIALNGAYLSAEARDVEAISIQNPDNFNISGNDVQNGLKEVDGVVTWDGVEIVSVGIIVWRHPEAIINNVRIESNRLHNLGAGIVMGAGPEDANRNVIVANNIVTSNQYGIKLNGSDSTNSYTVVHNTLYKNGTNLTVAPIGGAYIKGNLSIEPGEYHVVAVGAGGTSTIENNGYVPNGPLFMTLNTSDRSLDEVYEDLATWQQASYDLGSICYDRPEFINMNQSESGDFMLSGSSPFVDGVFGLINGVNVDFGGQLRSAGAAPDFGAWENQM